MLVKAYRNGPYVLPDGEDRRLAKTWNDVNIRKYYL